MPKNFVACSKCQQRGHSGSAHAQGEAVQCSSVEDSAHPWCQALQAGGQVSQVLDITTGDGQSAGKLQLVSLPEAVSYIVANS